jgi:hypothetical protein
MIPSKKPSTPSTSTVRQFGNLLPGLGVEDGDRPRARLQAANPKSSVGVGVHSKDGIGVAVLCPAKGNDFCMVKHLRLPYLECALMFQVSLA